MWYAQADWAYLWYSSLGNLFQFTGQYFLPCVNNNVYCGTNGQAWIAVYAYAYPGSSGRAYKQDIAETDDALEMVKALRAVNFRWREGPDTALWHHGFIADEAAAVLGVDWGGYHRNGEHEAIDRTEMVAVLWQAVRELAAEVAALKGAVNGSVA